MALFRAWSGPAAVAAVVALAPGLAQPAHAEEPFDIASAAAPKFRSFASPFLLSPTNSKNVTCYVSNVGKRSIALKNLSLRQAQGSVGAISTTCGSLTSFNLAPGSTCFIGAAPTEGAVYCSAQADDVTNLRGSLEARDQAAAVIGSTPLAAMQSEAASVDEFETIASAPIYGSQAQNSVSCIIANVGSKTAKLKNLRLVSSTGQNFQVSTKFCYVEGGASLKTSEIKPGSACLFTAEPIPPVDLQCLAQVTRKSDIRGLIVLRTMNQSGDLNTSPLQ